MLTLAFIGLGRMGTPMLTHIISSFAGEYEVRAFDVNRKRLKNLESHDVRLCDSPQEAAREAQYLFMSIPDSSASKAVLEASRELMNPGSIVVNLSSIDPKAAADLSAYAEQKGVKYLDAPVTGNVVGAEQGTLTTMVGGDVEDLEAVRPFLDCFTTKIVHVGPVGLGSLMKAVNGVINNLGAVITIEGLLLGLKGGLDADTMMSVLNSGPARNYFTETRFPKYVLSGTYDDGMRLGLVNKDLDIALEEAARLGIAMPISRATREIWRLALELHGPMGDTTRVVDAVSIGATGTKWDNVVFKVWPHGTDLQA